MTVAGQITDERLVELMRWVDNWAPGHNRPDFQSAITELQHRREAEAKPFCYVREWPATFDPQNGGEPASIDFSDVSKPGYEPLFKAAASPASGVRVKAGAR